jgi:RND superfamily putative drug exporter
VIRCLLVPAAMRLLGDRAWWFPGPLARVLPEARLESDAR